jgi:hypothetical protein
MATGCSTIVRRRDVDARNRRRGAMSEAHSCVAAVHRYASNKNPPSKEDVERIKSQMLRNLEQQLANRAQLGTGGLPNAVANGNWRLAPCHRAPYRNLEPGSSMSFLNGHMLPDYRAPARSSF